MHFANVHLVQKITDTAVLGEPFVLFIRSLAPAKKSIAGDGQGHAGHGKRNRIKWQLLAINVGASLVNLAAGIGDHLGQKRDI